jgi:hypothetical protein
LLLTAPLVLDRHCSGGRDKEEYGWNWLSHIIDYLFALLGY